MSAILPAIAARRPPPTRPRPPGGRRLPRRRPGRRAGRPPARARWPARGRRGRLPALPDAFQQYTSGSTGDSKGGVVTQDNLVANCRIIAEAFAGGRDTVMVSWLPLLHDMGLIGSLIHPLWLGATAVHMTPQVMIRQPLRGMQAVHRCHSTLTGVPDFAWRLLCGKVAPETGGEPDLALDSIAAVRPRTIPRTTSGKGGRIEARDPGREGSLGGGET